MEEFLTYEYVVEPKGDPKLKKRKILLMIGYIVYCLGLFTVVLTVGRLFLPLFAMLPLTLWIIYLVTWRYTKPEYEYSMTSGVITFSVIYGSRVRRKKFEFLIRNMETVAPYTDMYKDKIKDFAPESYYNGLSSGDSPDAYFALFETEDGEKCVFYFEATAKALKILRHYNPKTVVSKVRY